MWQLAFIEEFYCPTPRDPGQQAHLLHNRASSFTPWKKLYIPHPKPETSLTLTLKCRTPKPQSPTPLRTHIVCKMKPQELHVPRRKRHRPTRLLLGFALGFMGFRFGEGLGVSTRFEQFWEVLWTASRDLRALRGSSRLFRNWLCASETYYHSV